MNSIKSQDGMIEILARCGYRCDLCPGYHRNIRTKEDCEHTSAGWLKYVGEHVPPDVVPCPGCLAVEPFIDDEGNPLRSTDPNCSVKPCVIERGLENCSCCPEFSCEKLEFYMNFMEKKHGDFSKITQEDFENFIRPYLSKERLLVIRKKRGIVT